MKLKTYQKKLLYLLTLNSRYSNKDLSSILKVSEDTINYNKTQMLKENLFDYNIFFDYRKLGFRIHHLLLNVKDIESVDFKQLKRIKDVTYINTFIGKYNLHIIFIAKDEESKTKKIKEIGKVLSTTLNTYDLISYEKQIKLTHILPEYNMPNTSKPKNLKNKLYKLDKISFVPLDYKTDIKLDKKDIEIIKYLLQNPCANLLDISRSTSISRDTIRDRIYSYVDSNFLLHIGILPNLKKFNYFTYCLLINLKDIDSKKIRRFMLSCEYVFYCEECRGNSNLFVYIWAKTPQEFSLYFKELEDFLGEGVGSQDLLFFDDLHLQREFPTSLFE